MCVFIVKTKNLKHFLTIAYIIYVRAVNCLCLRYVIELMALLQAFRRSGIDSKRGTLELESKYWYTIKSSFHNKFFLKEGGKWQKFYFTLLYPSSWA